MRTLLLVVAALAIASCDSAEEPPPRQLPPSATVSVTYRIVPTSDLGAVQVDAIRFTGANGEQGTLGSAPLPWTLLVVAPSDEERLFTLEAELTAGGDATGMIATVAVDGAVVSQGVVAGQVGGLNQTRIARASHLYRP